jgi:hypothetical protein
MKSTKRLNRGYIPETIITRDQYVLGGFSLIPKTILSPNGQWDIPAFESQKNNFTDTWNCTAEGLTNQIEMYLLRLNNELFNFSDRALGIMAGTYPPGNSPQKVYETVRRNGLVDEKILPFSDDIDSPDKYYIPHPLPNSIKSQGKEWIGKYDFLHEWVSEKDIKETLKYSPLCVAVYAWELDNGVYVRKGQDTHWTTIYGTYDNGDWKCFDSYEPFIKRLDKNFGFTSIKRIYIGKKQNFIKNMFKYFYEK